jgi:ABC-type nitrate/sulfonate/bicarbonate transport system substrate-binding protein
MKKSVYLLLLAALIVGGYYFLPKKEKRDPISNRIRIAYNAQSVTNAGIIVAQESNFFQKNGVEAELIPLKGGKEVAQAIAAGQADTGLGGFPNFMSLMEKGAPIRYIAASASSSSFVFVRKNEFSSFSDLYGKKVSVSVNGINEMIFRSAMDRENIDLSKMKIEDVEREYQIAALLEKKVVDAVVVSEQDTDPLIEAGAVVLSEWDSKGYSQEAEPRNQLAINVDFLNKNEALAEKLLNAYIEAERLIATEPEKAAQLVAKHIEKASAGAIVHKPEKIAEQWKDKKTENMVWQDPSMTMSLAKKAREMGLVEKELRTNDVFDLRFEEKLKSAQNEINEILERKNP